MESSSSSDSEDQTPGEIEYAPTLLNQDSSESEQFHILPTIVLRPPPTLADSTSSSMKNATVEFQGFIPLPGASSDEETVPNDKHSCVFSDQLVGRRDRLTSTFLRNHKSQPNNVHFPAQIQMKSSSPSSSSSSSDSEDQTPGEVEYAPTLLNQDSSESEQSHILPTIALRPPPTLADSTSSSMKNATVEFHLPGASSDEDTCLLPWDPLKDSCTKASPMNSAQKTQNHSHEDSKALKDSYDSSVSSDSSSDSSSSSSETSNSTFYETANEDDDSDFFDAHPSYPEETSPNTAIILTGFGDWLEKLSGSVAVRLWNWNGVPILVPGKKLLKLINATTKTLKKVIGRIILKVCIGFISKKVGGTATELLADPLKEIIQYIIGELLLSLFYFLVKNRVVRNHSS